MQEFQHTLAKAVEYSGVGLHTNMAAHVVISPAGVDTGIVFKRTDLDLADTIIPAHTAFVAGDIPLCTTLRNKAGASVQTVEHLMAALSAAGIDNAVVEISGPEVPILDGSAASWIKPLLEAGTTAQDKPCKRLKILKPVRVQEGDRWLQFDPADNFSIDIGIHYDHPSIGTQRFKWDGTKQHFAEIAHAKTFGFRNEVEQLWASGMGKGGTLQNVIIFDEYGVMNPEALHYPDNEVARHKVLDVAGDSALSGMRISGRITGHAPGHQLTHKLMNELFRQKDAWQIEGAGNPKPRTECIRSH